MSNFEGKRGTNTILENMRKQFSIFRQQGNKLVYFREQGNRYPAPREDHSKDHSKDDNNLADISVKQRSACLQL